MFFISYSSKDNIEKYLEKLKARVGSNKIWFAPEKIKGGENFAKEIENAIKKSKGLILFFSKNSMQSPHVMREVERALFYNLPIFPIRIENIIPTEEWAYFLSTTQWIDIFSNENEFNELLDRLLKIEIDLSEDELFDFCKLHFEEMGYKTLTDNNFIKVNKNNISFYVHPIYKKNINIGEFKIIEAYKFWEFKELIFHKKDLEKFFEQYKIEKEPTFNQIMLFANKMKTIQHKKTNIVFYLYIKNPPIFTQQEFEVGLKRENTYKEKEKMPQIFLNSTFYPIWWGVGRDNLEIIKGDRYKNITFSIQNAYNELKLLKKRNNQKESYNGKIAETLCEVFFKNNGYLVQKFGIENIFGNSLKFINKNFSLSDENKNVLFKYMTLPDFLIIKLNSNNEIEENFLVDVKYRFFANKKELKDSIENGDIKKQVEKYSKFWGDIYLFLIADFIDETKIFFDKVSNIKNREFKTIDQYTFNEKELEKLDFYVKKIWI